MAFTIAQLDAIDAALTSGELIVEYEGKKVQYRSMADLMQARELVRAELIAAGQLAPPATTTLSYARRERN